MPASSVCLLRPATARVRCRGPFSIAPTAFYTPCLRQSVRAAAGWCSFGRRLKHSSSVSCHDVPFCPEMFSTNMICSNSSTAALSDKPQTINWGLTRANVLIHSWLATHGGRESSLSCFEVPDKTFSLLCTSSTCSANQSCSLVAVGPRRLGPRPAAGREEVNLLKSWAVDSYQAESFQFSQG